MTAPREPRSEQSETTDTPAAQADPRGLCRAFLRDLEVRGASAATRRSYSSDLQQFLEWLTGRELTVADLSRRQVRAFSAELGRRGYAPATLARKLSTLRGLTRYLTETGVLAADPARSLPGPRRRRRLPRVLSVADVDTLVAATDGTDPLALARPADPRAALRLRPAQHGTRGAAPGGRAGGPGAAHRARQGRQDAHRAAGRRGGGRAQAVPGTRPRRARTRRHARGPGGARRASGPVRRGSRPPWPAAVPPPRRRPAARLRSCSHAAVARFSPRMYAGS